MLIDEIVKKMMCGRILLVIVTSGGKRSQIGKEEEFNEKFIAAG